MDFYPPLTLTLTTRAHITVYAHSRITPTCLTSCWGGTSAPDLRCNVADLRFVRCGMHKWFFEVNAFSWKLLVSTKGSMPSQLVANKAAGHGCVQYQWWCWDIFNLILTLTLNFNPKSNPKPKFKTLPLLPQFETESNSSQVLSLILILTLTYTWP